ncbi:Hypothetical protein POVR1_LOCUS381 [uncultured virus]|nr:Hypothetical protein POVR1_LOCUS381 [uncultured virus]
MNPRQYRGYQHPTTREEMGLRPGEVQTKIFHPRKFERPKTENPMDEEIVTLPNDGQPEIIDDLVYDRIDLNIKITPLSSVMAKTVPPLSFRPVRGEKATQIDTTKIDWSMVTNVRGKRAYTIPQLKQIIASKSDVVFPAGSKKEDYVEYILKHRNEWTK